MTYETELLQKCMDLKDETTKLTGHDGPIRISFPYKVYERLAFHLEETMYRWIPGTTIPREEYQYFDVSIVREHPWAENEIESLKDENQKLRNVLSAIAETALKVGDEPKGASFERRGKC